MEAGVASLEILTNHHFLSGARSVAVLFVPRVLSVPVSHYYFGWRSIYLLSLFGSTRMSAAALTRGFFAATMPLLCLRLRTREVPKASYWTDDCYPG